MRLRSDFEYKKNKHVCELTEKFAVLAAFDYINNSLAVDECRLQAVCLRNEV
jgi:hypothetical protein